MNAISRANSKSQLMMEMRELCDVMLNSFHLFSKGQELDPVVGQHDGLDPTAANNKSALNLLFQCT